ncbi:MAG TPA: alpha/beta hydrolase [Clostridia bacterium]|nr:alpha/beta hydrolase [Clostridia bacterium]HRU84477.1 alpha/beta hydrolase [Eubacteriales bacterium]
MAKQSTFARRLFRFIDIVFENQQNPTARLNYDGVTFEKDIVYYDAAPDACRLDIYYKDKPGKFPVYFYIHGGGFVAGDKKYRTAHSLWAADMGFFVINVNYGLAPEYKFPEPLAQLIIALNWASDNAEKYRLDLDNITLAGDSSGAYFAAELAAATVAAELSQNMGIPSPKVKIAACDLNCGPYDLETVFAKKVALDLGNKILKDFAGITGAELKDYKLLKECAPINYVGADYPPCFITHAKADFFCGGQGEAFISKLKENGVYFEEFSTEKFADNHCFSLGWKTAAAVARNTACEKFLRRVSAGEIKTRA